MALGLVLTLGGYTLAESTTQREAALAVQVADDAADAAQREQAAIAVERELAVDSAQIAVADATAVQTVAAGSVSAEVLEPLTAALAELTTLLAEVPAVAPVDPAASDASDPTAAATDPAVDSTDLVRVERASRSAGRTPPPAAESGSAPDTTSDAVTGETLAGAFAASDAAQGSPQAATEPSAAPVAPEPVAPAQIAPPSPLLEASPLAGPSDVAGAVPDDALAAGILVAAAVVADLTAQVKSTSEANVAAAQAVAAEAAAQAEAAAAAAAAAATKEAQRASLAAYANGRIPADALCNLSFAAGEQLRCDAADALEALNAGYRAQFGTDLSISDSYRSYGAQVACSRLKGRLCATPGTSNHGLGVAVDFGGGLENFGTKQHSWMVDRAREFDWILPDWASRSGSKPEPWHWEFAS